jgi:hypothetical protein
MATKYTKYQENTQNGHKIHKNSNPRPATLFQNWDFWYENMYIIWQSWLRRKPSLFIGEDGSIKSGDGRAPIRVTRCGNFSPIGRLFTLGGIHKIIEVAKLFRATIFHGTSYVLMLTWNGLGCILGDFFTDPSGHPGADKDPTARHQINTKRIDLRWCITYVRTCVWWVSWYDVDFRLSDC